MQSRYTNNGLKKTIDGRTVFQSKIYPNIPPSDDDIFVATETGDRFDTLAQQYYGDQSLWWIISITNTAVAGTSLPADFPQDSLVIPEGNQIRIPSNYVDVINSFKVLNNL